MPEQPTAHADLAGYLLGALSDEDRERFLTHLEDCVRCQRELDELAATTKLLGRSAPPLTPPPDLARRSFERVRELAVAESREIREGPARARSWFTLPRLATAAGVASILAAAVFAGTQIDRDEGPAGSLEIEAVLEAVGGGEAAVSVRQVGIGREIELSSTDLPILPKGEYYELWFVAPDDTPSDPNRISAGTFHPDEDGRSDVSFTAAVDPAKYPVLSITAEPGDGDPAPSGDEVMRADARE